jgi:hypothetical protein
MGILNWIFGRRKQQDTDCVLAWDFRKSERPSDHKWRWHLNDVGGQRVALALAGIKYRLTEVTEFISAAHRSEQSGSQYGILIEREPANPADSNAICVKGWIGDPSRAIQLGYLYREDAKKIAKDFPANMPLAAALWRVYSENPEKLWIGIRLLIPAKNDSW